MPERKNVDVKAAMDAANPPAAAKPAEDADAQKAKVTRRAALAGNPAAEDTVRKNIKKGGKR